MHLVAMRGLWIWAVAFGLSIAPPDLLALDDESACTPSPLPGNRGEEALWLGRKVLAVRAALRNPGAPESLKAIVELGSDSRYYVMVRGWLVMQLQGDLSIVDAGNSDTNPDIMERVEFLQEAIRAIDLE